MDGVYDSLIALKSHYNADDNKVEGPLSPPEPQPEAEEGVDLAFAAVPTNIPEEKAQDEFNSVNTNASSAAVTTRSDWTAFEMRISQMPNKRGPNHLRRFSLHGVVC